MPERMPIEAAWQPEMSYYALLQGILENAKSTLFLVLVEARYQCHATLARPQKP